jgi:hypothetical protein
VHAKVHVEPLQTLIPPAGGALQAAHVPPQSSVPPGQVHADCRHDFPPVHAFPQLPQLVESLLVSTQAPPQIADVPPLQLPLSLAIVLSTALS